MFRNWGKAVVDDWPTKGFDINVVENGWPLLQRDVWQAGPYKSLREFKAAVKRSWRKVMTPAVCARLCKGVPKRLKQIKSKKGAHIRY